MGGVLVSMEQHPGQAGGGYDREGGPRQPLRLARSLEETDIEGSVVGNQDSAPGERQERVEDLLDAWRLGHCGVGDSRESGDERRDGNLWIHEGVELAGDVTAAATHRTDLRDPPVVSRSTTTNLTADSGGSISASSKVRGCVITDDPAV